MEEIKKLKAIIAAMPTYGYRRVHAILRHNAREQARPGEPNPKRGLPCDAATQYSCLNVTLELSIRAVMMALLRLNARISAGVLTVSRVATTKEKLRIAFLLNHYDRETITHVATIGGIKSQDVQDIITPAQNPP